MKKKWIGEISSFAFSSFVLGTREDRSTERMTCSEQTQKNSLGEMDGKK